MFIFADSTGVSEMMKAKREISAYTAAITGGGFLFSETDALLPLLQSEDRDSLLDDEAEQNRVLMINAVKSRRNAIGEIRRRYFTMDSAFWTDYQQMSEDDRRVALLMVILKTYRILFDFHVYVTLRKWRSIAKSLTLEDIMIEMNEISAKDEHVDSWTEKTKQKVGGAYLTILRRAGMLDDDGSLQPLRCSDFSFYLRIHESWFLEACLLEPYEIDEIRRSAL